MYDFLISTSNAFAISLQKTADDDPHIFTTAKAFHQSCFFSGQYNILQFHQESVNPARLAVIYIPLYS